jgi:hypothetical protein
MTEYILMKRGLYYRPNAQGYTPTLLHAGIYSAEEAAERCEKSAGVTKKRLIDTLAEIDLERKDLHARLGELDRFERKALGLRDDG